YGRSTVLMCREGSHSQFAQVRHQLASWQPRLLARALRHIPSAAHDGTPRRLTHSRTLPREWWLPAPEHVRMLRERTSTRPPPARSRLDLLKKAARPSRERGSNSRSKFSSE